MSGRGMKKWAPFSSLIEQGYALEEMRYHRNKINKPLISNEQAEKINRILTNYHGQSLKITFYYDGYLYQEETTIKTIDIINKRIVLSQTTINLKDIINLEDRGDFED